MKLGNSEQKLRQWNSSSLPTDSFLASLQNAVPFAVFVIVFLFVGVVVAVDFAVA